jgi:predicted lipid-binding transport protein (Tim44 family)
VSRLAFAVPALLVFVLMAADVALGQAGGGSSDYGGGGGGGGGGGSDFGGGDSSSGDGGEGGSWWVFAIGAGVFLVIFTWQGVSKKRTGSFAWPPVSAVQLRRRRVREVERAAGEAGEDDERFLPERVHAAAEQLFLDAQNAWDARDRTRLAMLLDRDLLVEWERRLDDFDAKGWHNRAEVLGDVRVDYVGVTNREEADDDRVVVLIEATLRAYVVDRDGKKILRKDETDDAVDLSQYWTLGLRDGRWILLSIEERAEGEHHLSEPIVGSPWSDDQRLRDEALIETVTADGLPPGYKPADLVDLDFAADARGAALDLAVADARFAPDVLEAAARSVVEAWAQAVDGVDAPLEHLASRSALRTLLYEGDNTEKTRVVVRGPRVKRVSIVVLDAKAVPATMTIEVELGGRRYVQDRDTAAVLSGSKDDATVFTERWTLSLDGPEAHPWRLTEVMPGVASA